MLATTGGIGAEVPVGATVAGELELEEVEEVVAVGPLSAESEQALSTAATANRAMPAIRNRRFGTSAVSSIPCPAANERGILN
jgi:hypothetical protein